MDGHDANTNRDADTGPAGGTDAATGGRGAAAPSGDGGGIREPGSNPRRNPRRVTLFGPGRDGDQDAGNAIRGGGLGADADSSAGGTGTGAGGTGRGDGSTSAGARTAPGNLGIDGVAFEAEGEAPRQKRAYTRRAAKKIAITANDVEEWTVSGFALVAMIRQRPWWQVEDRKREIAPWSGHAAIALNPVVEKLAAMLGTEAAGNVTAIVSGGIALSGLGMMVYVRIMADWAVEANMRAAQAQQTAERADEYVREPNGAAPGAARHRPGTGAAPAGADWLRGQFTEPGPI